MDCHDYITELLERKKVEWLLPEEREVIQHLKHQGYSNRAIVREIGHSPTTDANEVRCGAPLRKSDYSRKLGYRTTEELFERFIKSVYSA